MVTEENKLRKQSKTSKHEGETDQRNRLHEEVPKRNPGAKELY